MNCIKELNKEPIYCELCGVDITYNYKYQDGEFDYLCEECYFDIFESEVQLWII